MQTLTIPVAASFTENADMGGGITTCLKGVNLISFPSTTPQEYLFSLIGVPQTVYSRENLTSE